MNKILYAILATISVVSCSTNYSIKGSSNISMLDDNVLYLKADKNKEMKNIDSCNVVHGQFKFSGSIDSTKIGFVCKDNDVLLPVVLEEGEITLSINNTGLSCTGTELNDKLNTYMKAQEKLQNQYAEIINQARQMEYRSVTGEDIDLQTELRKLDEEGAKLALSVERLTTEFIEENFDNVLGPFVFLQKAISDGGGYPQFTPWVETILSKATNAFKQDPDVKEWIEVAQRNKNIENGTEQFIPQEAPLEAPQPADVAATPAEMAQPAQ